jgi:hypothetical protein
LIIAIFFLLLRKKNKNVITPVAMILVLFGMFGAANFTEAFDIIYEFREEPEYFYPTITMSTPSEGPEGLKMLPGTTFNVTGSTVITFCDNDHQEMIIDVTLRDSSGTAIEHKTFNADNLIGVCPYNDCHNNPTRAFTHQYSLGLFTAPAAAGNYAIDIIVDAYHQGTFYARTIGTQSFQVVPPPIGYHDGSNCVASWGWACDANKYSEPVDIHFYKDGPAGTGTIVGSTQANIANEDGVTNSCGGTNYHRFYWTTPDSIKNGQDVSIYAYAIGLGGISNPLLGYSPLKINCQLPVCNNSTNFACTTGTSGSNVPGSCGGNATWTCNNDSSTVSCSKANAACNLTATCPSPGTSATLTWSALANATYYFKINDNDYVWTGLCNGEESKGNFCRTLTTNWVSVTSIPGETYNWWVYYNTNNSEAAIAVGQTFTCVPPEITVTCSGTPTTATASSTVVTWSATAAGGTGGYTYNWKGTENLSGSASSVSKIYASAGSATSSVTVTSRGAADVTKNCSVAGSLSNAVTVNAAATPGVCGGKAGDYGFSTTAYRNLAPCGEASSLEGTAIPAFPGAGDHAHWKCNGSNGGSQTTCTANHLNKTLNPNLDCSLSMNIPTGNPTSVNVNTKTSWFASTTPICSNCSTSWTINSVLDPQTYSTLDKIFTTTGFKTINAQVSSPENYGTACSATVNVVQTGGGIYEI